MKKQKIKDSEKYIPGLHYHWFTKFYDLFLQFTLPEKYLKSELIKQADLIPGNRILDIGCGTGTLTIMVKKAYPNVEITGYDIDANMLRIAEKKAERENVKIRFEQGSAIAIKFPDASFDKVFASLMIHHLSEGSKITAFREISRVLKPGGKLLVLDFGKPVGTFAFLVSLIGRNLEFTKEGIQGKLPDMLKDANLSCSGPLQYFTTIFGTMSIFKALK